MNTLDYLVLLTSMLGIAAYGIWATRGRRNLNTYLKGSGTTPWLVIGLSVMATQASAITFLSTPGQGYNDGLGFVQFYFGVPIALIIISVFFLPIYRRLNICTAYEFLGQRFDTKTRLLGASLFLLQRGLGAGITIYAPAIVLSTVMGWSLDLTILCSGILVIIYTVTGGSDAVTLTQKYQIGICFAGMIVAFVVLLCKLPPELKLTDALSLAGNFHKLKAIDLSPSLHKRYTLWSGLIAGTFLQLSYFGTDQSQVQRYIGADSLRQSRMGLMFNAVLKIPMQLFILLLGVSVFVFYQFQQPPIVFNQVAWKSAVEHDPTDHLKSLDHDFAALQIQKEKYLQDWLTARHSGNLNAEQTAAAHALTANDQSEALRAKAKASLPNDADYVFITFILHYLPHGVIGLLIAAFFAAALSSKAAELNALGSTTTVDVYRHIVKRQATDAHYLAASKCFTIFWGLVALAVALFANLLENLIQAVNIIGSVFYGPILGLFLIGFFLKRIPATAAFWSALISQALVLFLYFKLDISYLWYNLIGCAVCVILSLMLQPLMPKTA